MKKLLPLTVLLIFLLSCQNRTPAENQSDSTPEAVTFSLTEVWRTDQVMKTPESVLYDPARDILYVANMNRDEEGDDTGFISKLATDGTVIELEWITGLNEPRGMGIYENMLFATDMNRVIAIDLDKGELVKSVPVEGSEFLNDLTIAEDGTVYFSDSRTGKVQVYKDDMLEDWLTELNGPNGLFDLGDEILLGASGDGELRKLNKETGEYTVMATGIGVDGIEYTGIEDYYIVSEWKGRIHVVGQDTMQTVLETEEQEINSADLGFHIKDKMVYVPTFFDNRVVAYKLEKK